MIPFIPGEFFRAEPPIGEKVAKKGTKITCLHCEHVFTLKMDWKVGALIAGLRLHRLLECPSVVSKN